MKDGQRIVEMLDTWMGLIVMNHSLYAFWSCKTFWN